MRTLKAEVGQIPLGATHYSDEEDGRYFCWYKIEGGVGYIMPMGGIGFRRKWYECENGEYLQPCVKRISPVAATETQEEKEVLDNIKVTKVDDKQSVKVETEHQKEMAEFDWDGEGLPHVGAKAVFSYADFELPAWLKIGKEVEIIAHQVNNSIPVAVFRVETTSGMEVSFSGAESFAKPESPEDKEEREREESINEIEGFICNLPLSVSVLPFSLAKAIVDKTKYRKGVE